MHLTFDTANILDVCDKTGRRLEPPRAERVARYIQSCGGLDPAIAAAAHDQAFDVLADLSTYRAARTEVAEPARLIARLRREADAFDRQEERARAEAADLFGRAQFRHDRGDPFAADVRRQAQAAETCATHYQSRAEACRRLAADHEAAAGLTTTLLAIGA